MQSTFYLSILKDTEANSTTWTVHKLENGGKWLYGLASLSVNIDDDWLLRIWANFPLIKKK